MPKSSYQSKSTAISHPISDKRGRSSNSPTYRKPLPLQHKFTPTTSPIIPSASNSDAPSNLASYQISSAVQTTVAGGPINTDQPTTATQEQGKQQPKQGRHERSQLSWSTIAQIKDTSERKGLNHANTQVPEDTVSQQSIAVTASLTENNNGSQQQELVRDSVPSDNQNAQLASDRDSSMDQQQYPLIDGGINCSQFSVDDRSWPNNSSDASRTIDLDDVPVSAENKPTELADWKPWYIPSTGSAVALADTENARVQQSVDSSAGSLADGSTGALRDKGNDDDNFFQQDIARGSANSSESQEPATIRKGAGDIFQYDMRETLRDCYSSVDGLIQESQAAQKYKKKIEQLSGIKKQVKSMQKQVDSQQACILQQHQMIRQMQRKLEAQPKAQISVEPQAVSGGHLKESDFEPKRQQFRPQKPSPFYRQSYSKSPADAGQSPQQVRPFDAQLQAIGDRRYLGMFDARFHSTKAGATPPDYRVLPPRIILVRHGESEGNVDNQAYCYIPDNQIPLTSRGQQQAQRAGQGVRQYIEEAYGDDYKLFFYISPYKRSLQTFQGIVQHIPNERVVGVQEEVQLREQDFGNFQDAEGKKREKAERLRFGRFFYRFPNGESGADVYDRVTMFEDHLIRDINAGRFQDNTSLVLVSHGLTLRIFLMRWFHWTVDQLLCVYNPPNCQPIVLERSSDDFESRPNGPIAWIHTKALYSLSRESREIIRGCTEDMRYTQVRREGMMQYSLDAQPMLPTGSPRKTKYKHRRISTKHQSDKLYQSDQVD